MSRLLNPRDNLFPLLRVKPNRVFKLTTINYAFQMVAMTLHDMNYQQPFFEFISIITD